MDGFDNLPLACNQTDLAIILHARGIKLLFSRKRQHFTVAVFAL